MKGNLLVITGSMYGRKSLELIEEIKSWEYRDIPYLAFSPIRDEIFSRGSNVKIPAIHIPRDLSGVLAYHVATYPNIRAVAIDEVSFYEQGIVGAVSSLLNTGIEVAVAGLDQDFRGQPFGSIGDLMALASDVRKRYSVCMKCKRAIATKTQRLLNGSPAPFGGSTIVVDGDDHIYTYECRCKDCHERG